jgi:hypothetical protein
MGFKGFWRPVSTGLKKQRSGWDASIWDENDLRVAKEPNFAAARSHWLMYLRQRPWTEGMPPHENTTNTYLWLMRDPFSAIPIIWRVRIALLYLDKFVWLANGSNLFLWTRARFWKYKLPVGEEDISTFIHIVDQRWSRGQCISLWMRRSRVRISPVHTI